MPYPVLLNLEGKRVIVVGGGQVAARKIRDVLDAGAMVTVISPTLHDSLDGRRFEWRDEVYVSGIITALKPFMVFAATDSPEVNAQVAYEAAASGALVNTVDHSANNDFSSMAAVQRGTVTLAAATNGASPALTAHLRRRLDETFGDEYEVLARWLGELRPYVLKNMSARRDFWTAVIESPVLDLLRQGDESAARETLDQLLLEAVL
jgi:precorrin-2 dehydrogenase / sirohydrochlorin ferrochelatase